MENIGRSSEERKQDEETVQVIEGTLDAGDNSARPEYESQINGTLVSDGDDLILEAHRTAGNPYTYLEYNCRLKLSISIYLSQGNSRAFTCWTLRLQA
jgi:hypothetical protein